MTLYLNKKSNLSFLSLFVLPLFLMFSLNVNAATQNSTHQETKQMPPISEEMQRAMDNIGKNTGSLDDGLTTSERIVKYVKSGFVHILPLGLDHILFVLALFFSTIIFKRLVWQVTAFTLAHSLTLALASMGVVSISSSIVEPLIALSIAWMAFANVRNTEQKGSQIWVVVIFGLLHGLGFATVLSEFGLPEHAFLTALLSFNIGVELGQLTVLSVAALLFYQWSKKPSYKAFVQVPMSFAIACVGLFWFFERIL